MQLIIWFNERLELEIQLFVYLTLALPGGETWPKIHGGRSVERFIFSKQCSIDLRPSRTGRKTGTKMDQSPIGKSVTPTRKFWPVCWTNWNKNFCSGQISKVCIASSNYHPNCTPIFYVNFLHFIYLDWHDLSGRVLRPRVNWE